MVATPLTVTTIDRSYGANDTYANPVGAVDNVNGNTFTNDGNTFMDVLGATATCTLTVNFASLVDSQVVSRTYSVLSTDHKLLGPWPTSIYGSTVTLVWSNANPKITLWRFSPNV